MKQKGFIKDMLVSGSKDPCTEHKPLVLSPSEDMCEKLQILQKRLSFRSKQAVVELAISRFWQDELDRDSETAGSIKEDENR
jgi:hypothetical protein